MGKGIPNKGKAASASRNVAATRCPSSCRGQGHAHPREGSVARRKAAGTPGGAKVQEPMSEGVTVLSDDMVAEAISLLIPRTTGTVKRLMRHWKKPILKATIPGTARQPPSKAMLATAKRAVLRFYAREE